MTRLHWAWRCLAWVPAHAWVLHRDVGWPWREAVAEAWRRNVTLWRWALVQAAQERRERRG